MELAAGLRSRRIAPRTIDVLRVVREVLARFEALARDDLELASEALPAAASVIELKARLLLPSPPSLPAEEDEEDARRDALAAVALLEELEGAIETLRQRREERRHQLPASAPTPNYPRRPRPLGIPLARLADIATRLQPSSYFEIVRDRFSMVSAIRQLLARLRPGVRQPLSAFSDEGSWATRTIFFAGALELVRDGRASLHQGADFAPIEVEGKRPVAQTSTGRGV